jgi:predicted MPP superfamily phosphohydrolase
VHYYFSKFTIPALKNSPQNQCKILLVHSPEIVPEAEENNYSLYLCGHTHSGQVALPNKKALITHVNTGREYSVGRWSRGKLQGYTSSGAGVSGLSVRFFTESEIAVITLRRPQV